MHSDKTNNVCYMNKKGNSSKKKTLYMYFACCSTRPAAMDGSEDLATEEGGGGLKYAKIEGKGGRFVPCLFRDLPNKESTFRQKKKNQESFKRVLKDFLFVAKKIKRTKVLQKLHHSNRTPSKRVERKNSNQVVRKSPTNLILPEVHKKVNDTDTSKSYTEISHSLSHLSVTTALSEKKPLNLTLSKPKPKDDTKLQDKRKDGQSSYVGIYLVIVCLLALAFCGKASATLFTAGWLYYVPRFFNKRSLNRRKSSRKDY